MSRPRRPIPPPPAPDAVFATFDEAAGLLRIRRRALDEIRRTDPTFPEAILIQPGQPRLVMAEVREWAMRQRRGWSPLGGRPDAVRSEEGESAR